MAGDWDDDGPAQAFHSDGPAVLTLRGHDVVLAAQVARAMAVETRVINQAVRRNSAKFLEIHTFQLTEAERDALASQGVISKLGRGGSRALPWVFTITGVARLATVLDTPAALDATDRMINLFLAVRARVAEGSTDLVPAPQARLPVDQASAGTVQALRRKLFDALTTLLDTVVDPANKTTVRDELGDVSTHALTHLKEYLKTRGLENEKLHADIALILANARAVQERAAADVRKSDAQTEAQILENIKTRIGIVEQLMKMADALEPNAVMTLLDSFPVTRRLSAV